MMADIELPLVDVLVDRERNGIAADLAGLTSLEADFAGKMAAAQADAYAAIDGEQINLGSPKQLQVVLFDKLGMPKTKRKTLHVVAARRAVNLQPGLLAPVAPSPRTSLTKKTKKTRPRRHAAQHALRPKLLRSLRHVLRLVVHHPRMTTLTKTFRSDEVR